jgi:hypothetical protein
MESYFKTKSESASDKNYYEDFASIGDFWEIQESRVGDKMFDCCYRLYLRWNGKKWVENNDDYGSYVFSFLYKSKKEIKLLIKYTEGFSSKKLKYEDQMIDLIKSIGKQYYLRNACIDQAIKDLLSPFSEGYFTQNMELLSFENLEEIINHYEKNPKGKHYCDHRSWSKIMTLEKAKELMSDLKIEIRFPE